MIILTKRTIPAIARGDKNDITTTSAPAELSPEGMLIVGLYVVEFVGLLVGAPVVGEVVGLLVGLTVGLLVGAPVVGAPVVGEVVGLLVGLTVGLLVGAIVVALVGVIVGLLVGAPVVGLAVGALVSVFCLLFPSLSIVYHILSTASPFISSELVSLTN